MRSPSLTAGTLLLLIPAALVGAWGLGWLVGLPIAAVALWLAWRWLRTAEQSLGDAPGSARGTLVWPLLLVLALIQLSRVGVFVVDPERRTLAALPNAEEWAVYHTCFTGYTEAARLAFGRGVNIYDSKNYEDDKGHARRIGLLHVDEYEYPPPFLPLPALLSAVTGHDVLRARAVFFGLQVFALTLVIIGTARRLAPLEAAFAWRLMPGVLAAFQTVVGLQYGNFQAGAFAIAVAGMLGVTAGRVATGAPLLAFAAAAKLFPGLLLPLLVATRRWRAVVVLIAWMLAFAVLSYLMFGSRPYVDFVNYQLPAISSGSGFAWSTLPFLVPTNYGVSAIVLKLSALGLPVGSLDAGMRLASIYGLVLVALVVLRAVRAWRGDARWHEAADSPLLWLAILNLASFRSPYVADAQATMGTLWLAALVVAAHDWRGWRLATLATFCALWAITFEGLAPQEHSTPLLLLTLALQVAGIAFNGWVLVRAPR